MPVGSIIIVSRNSGAYIEACLRALARFVDWKIILVDNSSSDDTVEKAQNTPVEVCMVLNAQNIGFAGAVNRGVQIAEGSLFVIVNPDALASPRSMDHLVQVAAADGIGAVGGLLTKNDGAVDKGFTVRGFPTLGSMLAEVLLVNRVWPTNPWNRRYRCLDLDYTKIQEVEQPAGACLAIKRQAWEDVGGFDESFFPVWFEDVDFCYRLRDKGWKILYSPEAVFTHAGGHSIKKLPFRDQQSFWYKNLLRYFRKHHRRWEVSALRAGIGIGLLLRAALAVAGRRATGVSFVQAMRSYWHVVWHYALKGEEL
jgi:N-acetylglucosaminyl-diphospho-decaprenol L-rhamnosyltransferase